MKGWINSIFKQKKLSISLGLMQRVLGLFWLKNSLGLGCRVLILKIMHAILKINSKSMVDFYWMNR